MNLTSNKYVLQRMVGKSIIIQSFQSQILKLIVAESVYFVTWSSTVVLYHATGG